MSYDKICDFWLPLLGAIFSFIEIELMFANPELITWLDYLMPVVLVVNTFIIVRYFPYEK